MPEPTTTAEVLERATTFDWLGDTKDEGYYQFVCDLMEAWTSGHAPPQPVLAALTVLYDDHDEQHHKGHVQLAQSFMTLWFQTGPS